MRTHIYSGGLSRFYRLDYKKLIIAVFLLRLILASAYDIFVTISGNDVLLPDGKAYSARGRYVNLLLEGYKMASLATDLLPNDTIGREVFIETFRHEKGELPRRLNESNIFNYIIGFLYFVFGYHTIWVRIFNICISMLSVYLLFTVARRHFGRLAANIFLLIGLLLPTQFIYSITLSRDYLRVLLLSIVIWFIYNMGDLWAKRSDQQSC